MGNPVDLVPGYLSLALVLLELAWGFVSDCLGWVVLSDLFGLVWVGMGWYGGRVAHTKALFGLRLLRMAFVLASDFLGTFLLGWRML